MRAKQSDPDTTFAMCSRQAHFTSHALNAFITKNNSTLDTLPHHPPPPSMNGYSSAAPANGGEASGVTIPVGVTNQPRVLVRSLNRDEVVFHLSGVDMAYANSFRRTMMADVPTICEWGWVLGWARTCHYGAREVGCEIGLERSRD